MAVHRGAELAIGNCLVAVKIGDAPAPAGFDRAFEQHLGRVHPGGIVESRQIETEVGARVRRAELAVFLHSAGDQALPSVSISLP